MTLYIFIFKDSEKLLRTFKFLTTEIAETLWNQMTYEYNCYVNIYHFNK